MTTEKAQAASLETILRPGQVVAGKYCVDRLIGKGGMAAVWAGVNQRTGKRVALKVILRSFAASPEAADMFRREALAASRVNHPNVVNVFDVVDHEGMTCIVMELLDGQPLGAYLAKRGLPSVEEAVALLLPAMRGVAAANAQGIIHRDLKPQNVFICIGADGRVLTTKVLDFGISVMVEKASGVETVVTTHGTPAYMSPEHIMNAPDIDERADVYGFGILLFECLTGRLPHPGDPGPSLLMRILNEPVPKASEFRPDLRPEVAEIVARATAKYPEDRFSSVEDFILALEDHFLPAVSLPRSLTPMVGVPLLEQLVTGPGAADPVVQLVRRAETSEEQADATRQLFLLAPRAGDEPTRRPPPGSHGTRSTRPPEPVSEDLMAVQRLKAGLPIVASVGAFVGALVLVGWLAMPRHRERAPAPPPNPSASASGSPVAPSVPVIPSVPVLLAPDPMGALVSLGAAPPSDGPARSQADAGAPARPGARRSAAHVRTRGTGRSNIEPAPASSPPPMLALPGAPAPKLPASRAGPLSEDDF